MAGFYTDPWSPPSSTLLTGPTTYNMMGVSPSPMVSSNNTGSLVAGAGMFGSVISGIGAVFSAMAQKQNLKFQSEMSALNAQHAKFVGDTNARIAELGAQSVLNQGQQQVASLTLRAGQVKSAQRASMAANGIDLGVGNAAEVQASTDIMKETDTNTITANAVRSAWGYRTQGANAQLVGEQQALNFNTQSAFAKATANAISPAMAGASSLMFSASGVASNWYQLKKAGVFDSPSNASAPDESTTSWFKF